MKNKVRFIKQTKAFFWLIVFFIGFSACANQGVQKYVEAPKYMFLFIGDGMGLSQMHAAEIMGGALNGEQVEIKKLSFSKFPGTGLMTTFSVNSYKTDSAASGTAIASGKKTINGRINIDPTGKIQFKPVAERAKENGMKVGVISNVPLNHATPACFYANMPSRGDYYEIAKQMVESEFDFFGGGGIKYPSGRKGLQTDILELAKQKGYKIIQSQKEFFLLGEKDKDEKIIAINEKLTVETAMPYRIDLNEKDLSLADYVNKSIQLLEDDEGFFMIVEGGEIDWAGHDNDAATLIKEVKDFDKAVQRAVQFYQRHPEDTLIVVTADHETGGMGLDFEVSGYSQSLEILNGQTISLEKFNEEHVKPYKAAKDEQEWNLDDFMPLIEEKFGLLKLSEEDKEELNDKASQEDREALRKMGRVLSAREYEELQSSLRNPNRALFGFILVKILNKKAGVSWTTGGHTAAPVPVFSIGKGYEKFVGTYDNTGLFKKMIKVMKLNSQSK
ncbi:MAG: alkaline phosphatase [Acidobacteriota bacterium]